MGRKPKCTVEEKISHRRNSRNPLYLAQLYVIYYSPLQRCALLNDSESISFLKPQK